MGETKGSRHGIFLVFLSFSTFIILLGIHLRRVLAPCPITIFVSFACSILRLSVDRINIRYYYWRVINEEIQILWKSYNLMCFLIGTQDRMLTIKSGWLWDVLGFLAPFQIWWSYAGNTRHEGTENETREAFGHGGLVLGRLHPYAALSLPKGLLSSAKSHFMITVTAR